MSDQFSHISDQDLEQIAFGNKGSSDLSHYSTEELEKLAQEPSVGDQVIDSAKNFGSNLLKDVVIPVGRAVDTYTGAPVRKAIGAAQDRKNPVYAFIDQFGADPDNAPSGKEIAQRAGFSEKSLSDGIPGLYNESGEGWQLKKHGWADPTASGVAGLGVDVAADWTNLIPASLVGKALLKTGAKSAEFGVKGAAKAADLATGSKMGTNAIEAVGSAVDRVVSPKRAPNWEKLVQVAKENNIKPEALSEALEFGPDSFITRSTRHIAEGPAGEKLLAKHNEGLGQINSALEGRTEKIGLGERPNAAQAGQIAREGYDKASQDFFSKMDVTHSSIAKGQPGLRVDRDAMEKLNSVSNGIEKYAKGLVKRGIDDVDVAQGKYLLRAVDQLRNGNGSYKQVHEALLSIRKKAFPEKQIMGQIPHDVDKMRELYFAGNDALVETVQKHVNPDFAKELISNNAEISSRLRNKSLIRDEMMGKAMPDEQIFNRLIGNTKKIEAFKQSVSPETFQKMKGAYLNKLITYNKDGNINFSKLSKDLDKNEHIVNALFAPEEISGIRDLTELGSNYGPSILSSSGTGASLSFKDMVGGISRGLVNERVIEKLKARARNAGALPSPGVVGNESGQVSADLLKRMSGLRENSTAQALKGAQVGAAADQNSRGLNYFIKNPSMIQHIKNPRLQQSLRDQANQQDQGEAPFSTGTISDREAKDRFIMGN